MLIENETTTYKIIFSKFVHPFNSAANEEPAVPLAPPSVSALEHMRLKEGDKLTLEVQVRGRKKAKHGLSWIFK